MGSICRKDKARCISSLDWIGKVSLQPSLCFAAQIVTYLLHNATSSTFDQLLSQMLSLLFQGIDVVLFCRRKWHWTFPAHIPKSTLLFKPFPACQLDLETSFTFASFNSQLQESQQSTAADLRLMASLTIAFVLLDHYPGDCFTFTFHFSSK